MLFIASYVEFTGSLHTSFTGARFEATDQRAAVKAVKAQLGLTGVWSRSEWTNTHTLVITIRGNGTVTLCQQAESCNPGDTTTATADEPTADEILLLQSQERERSELRRKERLEEHAADLQRYADFRPTQFDSAGLGCEDKQDWLVSPASRNRDSGPLDESNFAAALETMGGESDTVEIHRFGHWANGWFEILLVHPSRGSELASIACSLADYPVLDESDFSDRETEAVDEAWKNYGEHEFRSELYSATEPTEATRDWLESEDRLWTLVSNESGGSGDCYTVESDGGVCFDFRFLRNFDRADLARAIREIRGDERKYAAYQTHQLDLAYDSDETGNGQDSGNSAANETAKAHADTWLESHQIDALTADEIYACFAAGSGSDNEVRS